VENFVIFTLEIGARPVELVAMSGSSAATDGILPAPGARDVAAEPLAAASGVDTGEPVYDLPPLIEPSGFGETPEPVSTTTETAPSARVEPADVPPAVEPALERRVTAASSARWLATKTTVLRSRWRHLLIVVVAAIVLIVGFAYVLGIGPFSRAQQYRASSPPSDPAQRLTYYQNGAKAGDADAELRLAIIYAKGDGVAQDYATAATWFRAAADQGVARAQYDLGVLYERGRGVPVDQAEAVKWYLKAAEGKHPLAEFNLAVCYIKGQGTRKDPSEAALWYRRAAGQGVVQAMINLGMMYDKGDGVAISPVDAYAWYLAAGRRDNQPAERRAEEVFATLSRLDQIRAEALASDVNASIQDQGQAATSNSDATAGGSGR
jgi:hypothetical protein